MIITRAEKNSLSYENKILKNICGAIYDIVNYWRRRTMAEIREMTKVIKPDQTLDNILHEFGDFCVDAQ